MKNLIRTRIENLRPRLLDLTRRNPLIETKFSPRSNSHFRVVDELPEILFFNLRGQGRMRLVPLPPLDEDPKDEATRAFQDAATNGLLTDETYLVAAAKIDLDHEDAADKIRKLERELKDRIRTMLGMPARAAKGDTSLVQHARNNGVSPSYDLPEPSTEDDRFVDGDIQTLLLPKDLERKTNALISKCKTWVQETGINVLYAAFGFLEWSDKANNDSGFAPLILSAAQIDKKKTQAGVEFWIGGIGEDPEVNTVVAEKLRRDHGIEIPEFNGGSIEDYLQKIADISPKSLTWRVRRQVAIGVFPSAKMAMYRDLDTQNGAYDSNEVITSLFAGASSESDLPFADEYEVDRPEIESKVRCLVLDADSSQFSTLVDVSDGKNTAVEGPPGTGKSQTIVNAIANALADGKKVLFVAEKMAALDVVKSRLEAIGLGEFVLPLQADRSSREVVIQSVRDRLDLKVGQLDATLDAKITKFKETRAELATYVETISGQFWNTGFTVHEIIGKGIATATVLEGLPKEIQATSSLDISRLDRTSIQEIKDIGERVQAAWEDAGSAEPYWQGIGVRHLDKFKTEELSDLSETASSACRASLTSREKLDEFGAGLELPSEVIGHIAQTAETLIDLSVVDDAELVARLCDAKNLESARAFFSDCEAAHALKSELAEMVNGLEDEETPDKIIRAHQIAKRHAFLDLDIRKIKAGLADTIASLEQDERTVTALAGFIKLVPTSASWPLWTFRTAAGVVASTKREALAARSAANSEPAAASLLKKGTETGRRLRAKRDELAHVFAIERELADNELFAHAATFREAGIFRALSPRYRAAKNYYATHSRRASVTPGIASADLAEVIAWRESNTKFLSSPQLTSLFGIHFNGVDTDFDQFDGLQDYYDSVDATLPGSEHIGLRTFLKSASVELVTAIPDIAAGANTKSYDDVARGLDQRRTDIATLRTAIKELETLLHVFCCPAQMQLKEIATIGGKLDRYLAAKKSLDEHAEGKDVLGEYFDGADTEPESFSNLLAAADVIVELEKHASIVIELLKIGRLSDAAPHFLTAAEKDREMLLSIEALCENSGLSGTHWLADRTLNEAGKFLYAASNDVEGMQAHSRLLTARDDLDDAGFSWVPAGLLKHGIPLTRLSDILETVAFRALSAGVYEKHSPVLSKYNGAKLNECRKTLARLDREVIKLSRQHLRAQIVHGARPPRGVGTGRKSEYTELALIQNEVEKKKRHISARDLTRRAGRALMELKPCWMMSPLAVAQYLPRGEMMFDLSIIDEASQMPPEDSVGALVRSHQTMVVGDTNQLPPTSFFRKMIEDEDKDEDETVLEESVLEMANASFRPARRLRWHYRSQHSGLIKFSNHMVYNDDLVVFPSPTEAMPGKGVSLKKVDGLYHARTNMVEAKAIIDDAVKLMKKEPQRSLGIVTLNQTQQALIQEEWEYILSTNRVAAAYVDHWEEKDGGLERFFIKNLENVQGDERDVIFIGTVYGPEKLGGPVMQRFGPINGIAGKRRLNVLFSRAKQQIVTFSSMTASDVKADETSNPGTYMLKRWLEYSATGVLHAGSLTNKEPDSDFELFVMHQIKSMGCEAVPQVGAAGYFIDIGVRHPKWPHGFILGVECDGAPYHSSKSARDRDRLRQEVLEGLGWKFHRIWSTDWFNNPRVEASKLRQVIEDRLAELQSIEKEFVNAVPIRVDTAFESKRANRTPPIKPEKVIQLELDVPEKPVAPIIKPKAKAVGIVDLGDTVRVRYTEGNKALVVVTISDKQSDPSKGIVHHLSPVGSALLGAEEGEEIEILVGSYVRSAVIDKIISRNS